MGESGPIVVTGASGGLGKAVSIELAKRGLPVLMVFRDLSRGEVIRREVVDASHNDTVRLMIADLSTLDDVRRLAHDIDLDHGKISGLVSTAAVYTASRRLTADGLEAMFATNHLAPYLLTRLLLPTLDKGAPARVVLVSAPSSTEPDFTDLQGARQFRSLRAFGASKAGNLLFGFALARRIDPKRITVNVMHPGLMKSGLMGEASAPVRFMLSLFSRSPARAASNLADVITGKIAAPNGAFISVHKVANPPKVTTGRDLQEQMWRVSAELAGLPAD